MDAIYQFFVGLGDAIIAIFDFAISFFQDLIYIVTVTGQVLLQIPSYFSIFPSEMVTILVTIFGVVVIYKIMGREG